MRIDKLVMHADDVKAGSGAEFYGTPIREASNLAADVREELDSQARVRMGLGLTSVPAELLPGEVITDNTIRRSTAAEVVGEEFYDKEIPEGRQVTIEKIKEVAYAFDAEAGGGVLTTWRPNNLDIAILHEEIAA